VSIGTKGLGSRWSVLAGRFEAMKDWRGQLSDAETRRANEYETVTEHELHTENMPTLFVE
jgi:hypothetical protein